MGFQCRPIHTDLDGIQAGHGDAAAFAVAPVVHLAGSRQKMSSGNRKDGGHADDTAAAFGFLPAAGLGIESIFGRWIRPGDSSAA
jgi:hypothetical protein